MSPGPGDRKKKPSSQSSHPSYTRGKEPLESDPQKVLNSLVLVNDVGVAKGGDKYTDEITDKFNDKGKERGKKRGKGGWGCGHMALV